jgi:hypothetical protein
MRFAAIVDVHVLGNRDRYLIDGSQDVVVGPHARYAIPEANGG